MCVQQLKMNEVPPGGAQRYLESVGEEIDASTTTLQVLEQLFETCLAKAKSNCLESARQVCVHALT